VTGLPRADACCARAASGQAVALAISDMNSRRLIVAPKDSGEDIRHVRCSPIATEVVSR
jgi:hypothetical protein